MEKKMIIGIVCVVVVYVLSVLGASLLGFLSAYFWVGSPILASLLCAFSYAWLARRWRKSGLATVLSLAVVFFFLACGEIDLKTATIAVMVGVLSDVVRQMMGTDTAESSFWAYPILALAPIAWFIPLWTNPQNYYEATIEEMGQDYANVILTLSFPWSFAFVVGATALLGFVGIRLARVLVGK